MQNNFFGTENEWKANVKRFRQTENECYVLRDHAAENQRKIKCYQWLACRIVQSSQRNKQKKRLMEKKVQKEDGDSKC